jgi:NADH-quinone oxidoreductase subunit D
MELGALSMMIYGFREREKILDIFESASGLRMNMAYIRPGGLASDLADDTVGMIREFLDEMPGHIREYEGLLSENPIWKARTQGVGFLDITGCMALGITGPVLRSAGLPWDLRKTDPYCGYETYDFEVPTETTGDVYGRYLVRLEEIRQSLRICEQAMSRLRPGPVMVEDRKIAWPAQLAVGADGLGNSLEHIKKIMGSSMESLIHHFKLVTEGFRVPAGQTYTAIESPRGELGVHLVSDGGTRPYRLHVREPSFVNLQAFPAMVEGGPLADAIASGASLDPVMGGVDR